MGKEKKRQEDELDALLARFEAQKSADEAKKEREDLKKALKQLVLHLCWTQQTTGERLQQTIPYYLWRYVDMYASGDKVLLGEVMDFFNNDCKQGARRISCKNFMPAIIRIGNSREFVLMKESFELLNEVLGEDNSEETAKNEGETKEQGGEVNATERI